MHLNTLRDLLVHELQDLYSAEEQIIEALPKMANNTQDTKLTGALEMHLEESRIQLDRLKEVATIMNESLTGKECVGMRGVIKEGEKVLEDEGNPAVKDAAIIAAAQKVEHYEIAGYSSAISWAKEMDLDDVADMLQESLDEEKSADKKLTSIAEGGLLAEGINEEASDTHAQL